MKKLVMIDLETMSTRSDAAVVAIAIALQNEESPEVPVAQAWFIDPNLALGWIDPKTMDWWSTQKREIREIVFGGKLDPISALIQVEGFLDAHGCLNNEEALFFGDPGMFDLPILKCQFMMMGLKEPWTYRQERCARTMRKTLTDLMGQEFIESENKMLHHPLYDATVQLADLDRMIKIFKAFNGWVP